MLVETILGIRWINRSKKIIQLYHQFIINLLTAKSEFLTVCLSKIISCFIPTENEFDQWCNGVPSAEMEEKLFTVHKLLKKLIEVIPMIPVELKRKIRQGFPYFKQSNIKIAAYTHNILQILNYCPVITHDVFELVFEK